MTTPRLFAFGAALVDVIANVDEEFLVEHGQNPGGMTLSSQEEAKGLYAAIPPAKEVAGGSAANTAAIAANLGVVASFAGKTGNDQLGDIFWHDMVAQNVERLAIEASALPTGRCLSMVVPGGQRTMSTYLGASTEFTVADVEACRLSDAGPDDWVFLEAYMLDWEQGVSVLRKIMRDFPGKVALTLSDPRCVERHQSVLHNLIKDIDLVFGNELELGAFYNQGNFLDNIQALTRDVERVVCTHGPEGVYTSTPTEFLHQPALPVKVVDTTGAGDSFAGAVMWGLMNGKSLSEAASVGLRVAAHIIGQVGARPMGRLEDVITATP